MSSFSNFWDWIEEGAPEPEYIFRISQYINRIPIHSNKQERNYQNAIIQAFDWDEDYLREISNALTDKLIKCLEDYLGYSEGEWWFGYVIKEETPRVESAYNPRIDGTWRFYIEKSGRVVYERTGLTENL